ncbi:MAG: long-chain fatty acid--CoA ligase, partial [Anaerolineales bacterium]
MILTVLDILYVQANEAPEAPAIEAPGRQPLTYGQLWRAVSAYAEYLRGMGIHHPDRVAMCLPNGPEMAVAFLGVVCAAACAPLNPEYREREFEFFLEDLQPKAL